MRPKKIFLDTNFLMIPGQFGVDIFKEIERICDFPYELHILDTVIGELKNLTTKGKGKDKRAAKLALSLLKAKPLNITRSAPDVNVDDELIRLGQKHIIATQDMPLKRKVKKKIVLRQKKYLVLR